MKKFVARHQLDTIPHVVDSSVLIRFGVSYAPAWVFINQDGDVRIHAGHLSTSGLAKAIEDLESR